MLTKSVKFMSTENKTHIHWFGNDLRTEDQPFSEKVNESHEMIGLYVIDQKRIAMNQWGFRNMALLRFQVLREHLRDLQNRLSKYNVPLIVKFGDPTRIVPELVNEYTASLSFMKEYATDERRTQAFVKNELKNSDLFIYEGNFLYHPQNAVWENNFPHSFSKFRKQAEKHLKKNAFGLFPNLKIFNHTVETPLIKRSQRKMHDITAIPYKGGESVGVERINEYLFETKNASKYKETRNGLLGKDYSTKFSFWLSVGALSPNMIMKELKKYENEFGQNNSTYWIFFELLWRDFFRHAGKYYKDKIFYKNGLRESNYKYGSNTDDFQKWKLGKTKLDFINANMIELKQTGFMSNRGRQNVASYFTHDMKQDWRLGAAWFEHCLIDYDVYSNQGNWGYIEGTFLNPKGGSKFDIEFQANRYDEKRNYRKTWLKN